MWDLKACTVCFSTGVKLYSLNVGSLRTDFNLVSGLQIAQGNGMPEYLCVECSAYVTKFKKFRDKCHRAHYALGQILFRNKEIKKCNLKAFNRQHLKLLPTLSYIDLDRAHYEQVQFKLVKYCRSSVPQLEPVPIAHYSTLTEEDTFELEMKDVTNKKMEDQVKIELENASQMKVDEFSQKIPKILCDTLIQNVNSSSILRDSLEAKNELPTSLLCDSLEDNDFNKEENEAFDQDNNDTDKSEDDKFELMSCNLNNKADGSSFNEEYGDVVPISVKEAKAVVEVYKFCSMGDYQCNCGKRFAHENTIRKHARRHDMHISGNFRCEICDYFFKTAFLLQCHMTDHHMYKYLCKKCPEVSFSRSAAKHHYVWKHIQGGRKHNRQSWDVIKKPSWFGTKGGARVKGKFTPKVKKTKNNPKDFPIHTPISQEDQYLMVDQRKESRNYVEAKYKCDLCYRGYRLTSTYNKHMAKHDPVLSGNHQCDMCKLYFRDTRRLYKHMITYHIHKFSCRYCDFVCTSKGQALYHYRWHKNVTYDCPHCDKKFLKISTQLTHIRFKHPGTDVCNLCGHSFVSSSGLNCHKQMSHSKAEIDLSEAMLLNPVPTEPYYCGDCKMQFLNEQAYIIHLGSSRKHVETNVSVIRHERANRRTERMESKGRSSALSRGRPAGRAGASNSEVLNTGTTTATNCEVCGKSLASDVAARRHYEAEHPGTEYLKRYMCDVCGHTTKQYANLLVHMRVHTQEKPYECPHCDRRFSMPSNRDRHIVVHTGEKRYQCQHCSRRFTQSTAVKLHIQTVHMKIPYKPWDKKNRKRRKEAEPTTAGLELIAPPVSEGLTSLPQHKLLLEQQGDYITYVSYADEQ